MTALRLDVLSAGFAPVKGTRHLAYGAVRFDRLGPVGDRSFCLVDVDRRRVLRTVQNPALVAVVSRLVGDELEVALPTGEQASGPVVPTGEVVTCEYWGRPVELRLLDGPHSGLFSAWLGRPVRLAAAGRNDVVFDAPVTLVTTASLRDLGARAGHPDLVAEAGRFRASLLVHTETPYVEDEWLGQEVLVGDVRLRIGVPVPRCAVVDVDPVTGERGGRLLKALAPYRPANAAGEPCFGVYAEVVGSGTVTVDA